MGPAQNSKVFMMNYFWKNTTFLADTIERKENPDIIKHCIDEGYIHLRTINGNRLYILLDRGKKYIEE